MRTGGLTLALVVTAAVLNSSGAKAQTAPAGHLGAVDVFDAATRAAAAGRTDEALNLYDALTHDPDVEIRSEARFRKGQLLAAHHRIREAATTYRRLLDEKPYAARVRLELAALLVQLGDEVGARRQFRLAQAGKLPPEVAVQIAQFSRALRSPKHLGGSLDIAVAPDTNINRGTQARSLDTVIAPLILSTDARATSGIGLRLRPSGFAKQPLTDRLSLVLRAVGSADLYRQGSADDVTLTVLPGVEWRGARDQISGSYGWSQRWYGGAAFADSQSLTGEWLHQLNKSTQLSSTVSRSKIHYRQNPLQDGPLYDVNFGAEQALSPRSGVGLGIGASRQDALDPSYAFWAGGPSAYGWRDLGRITIFGAATARRLVTDERNFLFSRKRSEWFASGRIGVIARKVAFRGFSPTVRFGLERNASTVSIYDYRRAYAEFGFSRVF